MTLAAAIALCAISTLVPVQGPQRPGRPLRPWRQNQFLVTFWCPPPATDANLAAVKAEGYNLTWTPEDGLDVAQRHGLRAMLQSELLTPATLDNPEQLAKLDALIARVRRHPAMEAYFITDEPGAGAFDALGRLADHLRKLDPGHFAYINLFPTYANNQQLGTKGDAVVAYNEHLRQFIEKVKPALISWDHYHFFKEGDGAQYFLNLELVRKAALDKGLPFLNIIQACTIEPSWRLVNADELRFLVYTTLAYGARGISYFLYWGPVAYGGLYQDGKKMPLADVAAGLNKELAGLGPALMRLDSIGVYHTGEVPTGGAAVPASSPVKIDKGFDAVLGLFGVRGQANACMVVNRSTKLEGAATLRFDQRIGQLREFDRQFGRWVAVKGWSPGSPLQVWLRPGDGRLLRWGR